jgi:predicted RNA-binding Zn-ribbon protein involved in translation (DUF1610 family)
MTDIINEWDNTNTKIVCPMCGDYNIHIYNKKASNGDYISHTVRCLSCGYDDSMSEKIVKILRIKIQGSGGSFFMTSKITDDSNSIGYFYEIDWTNSYYWLNNGTFTNNDFFYGSWGSGKHLDHFELDGVNVGATIPDFTMNKDHTLVAVIVAD